MQQLREITSTMNTQQFEVLSSTLTRIADALEMLTTNAEKTVPTGGAVPDNVFVSPDVPQGYNTVLGYLAETHPEMLDLMRDPLEDTVRDGYWLTHQAHKRDIQVHQVEASSYLRDHGIEQVNAYPIHLLAERLA